MRLRKRLEVANLQTLVQQLVQQQELLYLLLEVLPGIMQHPRR
jgi:hypothetical protein